MNWDYQKHNWYISWYNLDNVPEDDYNKKYNYTYQDVIRFGKRYWKKIFNFRYKVDYIQDGYMETEYVGLQYVNSYQETSIAYLGKYKIFKLFFRDSSRYDEKGKWKLKYKSWRNDHVCGG